jgi:uncharacterized cupin superfamily protein
VTDGESESPQVTTGEGYAVSAIDALGDGPGFRKIRRALGVTAFGVNAVVMPPGIESWFHYHDEQEELYLVLSGTLEIEFRDGTVHRLEPGGLARVAAPTWRKLRNTGTEDAVYFCVGGKDGYVGRDAHTPEGEARVRVIDGR